MSSPWALRRPLLLGPYTLGAALAVAAGAALPGSPAFGDAAATGEPASVEVVGLGYGHGLGMGQWGAYGYASEYRWGYQRILSHYYGGTTLGHLASPEPLVTVRLDELAGRSVIASSLPRGLLVATWPGGGRAAAPALQVVRSGNEELLFSSPGCAGPWRLVARAGGAVTVASASSTSPAVPAGALRSEVEICLPGYGTRTYQGQLVVRPGGETDNVVGLEDYVDGVVPAESPASWAGSGGEAALEAQAVAARSYALAVLGSSGSVCDTTACQVYEGLPGSYGKAADAAVAATAGQVLYCDPGSACGPAGSVALAEYSASTGGWTAGGLFPPVPDLGDSVPANPVRTWRTNIPAARLRSDFPSIGTFESVEVTARNGLGQYGGRAESVLVTGTNGSVRVPGYEFAADFSLPSNWFEIVPGGSPPAPTTTTTTAPAATTTTKPPPSTTTTKPPPATTATNPPRAAPVSKAVGRDVGCWLVNRDGYVESYGAARSYGTALGTKLGGQVAAIAATPDFRGYWLAGRDGGVLAFGDATWYGSVSASHLHSPVVAMAATPDGRGYWLATSAGAVYAFGDARSYGSVGGLKLQAPVAGFAPTPDGQGYWLAARDGGIYTFGDARFYGSLAGDRLPWPIIAIVPSSAGRGYLLVSGNGGTFVFGAAPFVGSLPSRGVRASAAAVAPSSDGPGYYLLTTAGGVYAFGGATLPVGRSSGVFLRGLPAVAIACHRTATAS